MLPKEGVHYDIFPHYDIGDLVRVSDPRLEDDVSDSVCSFQVKRAFLAQPTWNDGHSVCCKE